MKARLTGIVMLLALVFASCQQAVKDAVNAESLPPIFPDYTEVTIPASIAPMNFGFAGKTECMDVVVKGSKEGELHVQGSYASFDIDGWHRMTAANKGGTLTFTVCIKANGQWTRYQDFNMYVSNYDLNDYGLTYRRIAPGYEVYSQMGLYERELSTFKERALLENTRLPGMCVNCHTPNATRPDSYVFHVRGEHGATVVQHSGTTDVLKATNEQLGGAMVYPYWHPSGRYCAFSTNQTRQGFHVVKGERIEVFDLSSDVFVYDVEKNALILDTLLMSSAYSENIPTFSPDGKRLYYTTALQQKYPTDFKKQRYSLCCIGFDAERGCFGQQVDTLFDAGKAGKSLSWPRPSYDGKYIMVTLLDYGYFSIWHKESDLWLIETATGNMRPLTEVNSDDAESYHNWSADSHWFVFTSRRENGLYSLLYLACIDDAGNATKPFLLPQGNPQDYYSTSFYSFNTPDFTACPVELDARKMAAALKNGKRKAVQAD